MSRSRVLVLGVCLALLLGAPILLVTRSPDADRSPFSSTYSSHPVGCKALYLLLEELKLPVMRLRTPLARLESHSGTLMIVNPRNPYFTRRERQKLKEWVTKGNRLVIFQGADIEREEKKGNTVAADGQSFSVKVTRASNLAAHFGLRIKRTSGASRSILPVFLPGMDEVGSISVSNEVRWKEPHSQWTSLAGDKEGPVLLVREMGNGKIAAMCDPTLPSNRFLDREHNLRLVLALLLADGTPREILFDEYHHGHVLSESLWGYVGSSVVLWALLQALLGTLLFFYSRRAVTLSRYWYPLQHACQIEVRG